MTDPTTQTSILASLLPRLPGDVTALPGTGAPLDESDWQDALHDLQDPEELAEAEARQLIAGTPWETEGDDKREDGRVVVLWVACIATGFVVLCAGLEFLKSGMTLPRLWEACRACLGM